MHYAYRFRLDPTPEQRERLDYHRDICRQLYNHALGEFEQIPESAGTLNQRVRKVRDQLTDLKEWWNDLNDLYSTVAQAAVMRIEDSIKALSELKQEGYNVGSLNWKAPQDFRSFTYVQSGFEFDSKNGQPVLSLSKLADIPIVKHREIPDDVIIKEVTIKKEPTGEWFASFAVDGKQTPENQPIPSSVLASTLGYSNTPTIPMEPLSGRLTCRTNVSGWNVPNVISHGKNMGRTTGRNNRRSLPNAMLT